MSRPCDYGMCDTSRCTDSTCNETPTTKEPIMAKKAKTQKIVNLYSKMSNAEGPYAARGMEVFENSQQNNVPVSTKTIFVTRTRDDMVNLCTAKGSYILHKHPVHNLYMGECNGVKVHVTLKVLVGKVIFWS